MWTIAPMVKKKSMMSKTADAFIQIKAVASHCLLHCHSFAAKTSSVSFKNVSDEGRIIILISLDF